MRSESMLIDRQYLRNIESNHEEMLGLLRRIAKELEATGCLGMKSQLAFEVVDFVGCDDMEVNF